DFAEVPVRLRNGTMMNLNDDKLGEHIKTLLTRGFYFKDNKDIDLVGTVVAHGKLNAGIIDNIGELNKNSFNINAEDAFAQGGESYKRRVDLSRSLLGFSEA